MTGACKRHIDDFDNAAGVCVHHGNAVGQKNGLINPVCDSKSCARTGCQRLLKSFQPRHVSGFWDLVLKMVSHALGKRCSRDCAMMFIILMVQGKTGQAIWR